MYRASKLDKVLRRVAHAYQSTPEDFNDTTLWSEVEDALNMPDESLGRRTLTDMDQTVWQNRNKTRAVERGEANEG